MAQRFLLNKLSLALKTARLRWEWEGFEDATQGKENARDRVPLLFRRDYQRGWSHGCKGEKPPQTSSMPRIRV